MLSLMVEISTKMASIANEQWTHIFWTKLAIRYNNGPITRGAGATGAAGETAPVAQTVRGQHGGNRLPYF